jgi:hypothetical protein
MLDNILIYVYEYLQSKISERLIKGNPLKWWSESYITWSEAGGYRNGSNIITSQQVNFSISIARHQPFLGNMHATHIHALRFLMKRNAYILQLVHVRTQGMVCAHL